MTLDEVEGIVGKEIAQAVRDNVLQALLIANRNADEAEAFEAVSELLISVLAAVIITLPVAAQGRADACARRISSVVAEALRHDLRVVPKAGTN